MNSAALSVLQTVYFTIELLAVLYGSKVIVLPLCIVQPEVDTNGSSSHSMVLVPIPWVLSIALPSKTIVCTFECELSVSAGLCDVDVCRKYMYH